MGDNRNLTPKADIQRHLLDFDLQYQQSLYRQVAYALGEKATGRLRGIQSGDGEFPLFPDMQPAFVKVGQSRRILNTQFIGMARVLSADPEPMFPQVDKFKGEVRKQFILERSRMLEWPEVFGSSFLDAEAAGVGIAQVGMEINPDTGFPHVMIQHVPCYNFVYERHARSPNLAKWCYAVHYLSIDDAVAAYGDVARSHEINIEDNGEGRPMKAVRVFEYFNKGVAGKAPTRAVMLGQMSSDPVEYGPNPYGACMPFGFWVYFLPPGMRRPMGRIPFQMATQEALNDLEQYLRAQLKQPEFTLLDAQAIDQQDLQNVFAGKVPAYVRVKKDLTNGMSAPAIRVPSGGVAQALIALQDMYERQFTTDSGVTEHERGNFSQEDRTLGENQLVDQRGGVQASWSELMAAKGYQRVFEKILHVASIVDRDALTVDVFGTNYLINNPADPDSTIQEWAKEPSTILIDSQLLRRKDSQIAQAQRVAALKQVEPYVGSGVDPMWFVEEMLKAIGEKDPREAMGGSDEMGQLQTAELGLPGQPGIVPEEGAQQAVQAA